MLVRVGSRGSRLALTQAELAASPAAPAGDRDRARPDHDRGRPRPDEAVRPDRRARRLRQGARGGAPRRADRRGRPLRQGHDLDGRGRARGRRLPRAGGSARRALRRRRDPAGDAGRHRLDSPPLAAAMRSSRRSRSSRCAGTSTRACASAASAASTRSCSPRPGSSGSGSAGRSAIASRRTELLPEAGQGALALQVRAGEEELVAAVDDAETRRRVSAERACVAAIGGGCLAPVAAHHDGRVLTALVADEDGAWVERRSGDDPAALAAELLRPARDGTSGHASAPPSTVCARQSARPTPAERVGSRRRATVIVTRPRARRGRSSTGSRRSAARSSSAR